MINQFKIKRIKIKPAVTIKYILIVLLLCFTALPLVYVISTAFKPLDELILFPPRFFVNRPTFENFSDLFSAINGTVVPFTRYIFNSLFTTVVTVVLSILVASLGAYGITKQNVLFAKPIFYVVTIALMFPVAVTQIPNFLIITAQKLPNTYWALILPKVAGAYSFFLMKQFCEQLPDPILEAARIDGAKEIQIFTKIALPFLRPAWATLAVFCFVASWNDFFSPLVYISDEALKTLPLALNLIAEGGNMARAGAMAAATFIMIIPTVVLFTFMQSKVMETMAHSGIK